jgi:glycine/D-amino acid oxidase-like deaminating enzyme
MNTEMNCDVAVIGGGVIGCAVAYYVAKSGARVAVIDRSDIGSGASSANAGSINMATKKAGLTLDLAMASQRLYENLAAELRCDIEYAVVGKLIVAQTEEEIAFLEGLAVAQHAAGAPVQIVSATQCRALNALLEGPVFAGLYCPTDAQANPFKVTQGFARAAQKLGVEILSHTEVCAVEVEGNRVSSVLTTRGRLRAKWVVNAAGAYSSDVGRMLGIEHGVLPRRGQLVVLEARESMPAVGVSGAGQLLSKHAAVASTVASDDLHLSLYYSSRPASGTILLGSTNEFAGFDTRTTRQGIAGICRCTTRAMPRLARLNAVRSWAGLRPYCARGPLLGRAGGPDGYVIATGHGGDGMALAPITGRYISALVAHDGKPYDLSDFLSALDPTRTTAAAVH